MKIVYMNFNQNVKLICHLVIIYVINCLKKKNKTYILKDVR